MYSDITAFAIVSQILVLVFNCNFFWLQWLLNPNNNNILEICVIFFFECQELCSPISTAVVGLP